MFLPEMFGSTREALVRRKFELLYPTNAECERMRERMAASVGRSGRGADEQVMRRVGGELFW